MPGGRSNFYTPKVIVTEQVGRWIFVEGTLQVVKTPKFNMGVSKNNGIPKSSILIGFSIINHPFWGTPIFGNTHMEPKNDGFQKESPIPGWHFQMPCLTLVGYLAVCGWNNEIITQQKQEMMNTIKHSIGEQKIKYIKKPTKTHTGYSMDIPRKVVEKLHYLVDNFWI